jgi:hypothetical protein
MTMAQAYTAAHFAHAINTAFRRILRGQPRQTLPTEVIFDGLTVFCGGILCDMARASRMRPDQRQGDLLA